MPPSFAHAARVLVQLPLPPQAPGLLCTLGGIQPHTHLLELPAGVLHAGAWWCLLQAGGQVCFVTKPAACQDLGLELHIFGREFLCSKVRQWTAGCYGYKLRVTERFIASFTHNWPDQVTAMLLPQAVLLLMQANRQCACKRHDHCLLLVTAFVLVASCCWLLAACLAGLGAVKEQLLRHLPAVQGQQTTYNQQAGDGSKQ